MTQSLSSWDFIPIEFCGDWTIPGLESWRKRFLRFLWQKTFEVFAHKIGELSDSGPTALGRQQAFRRREVAIDVNLPSGEVTRLQREYQKLKGS